MYKEIPLAKRRKIYVFTGEKKSVNWYCGEYKISAFAIGYSKKAKGIYFNFLCDNTAHLGSFIVLSIVQMIVLPFKHRLYFNEKKAKKRERLNWEKRESIEG